MPTRSRRPYLIRAIFDWATENGFTPHLAVAADYEGVSVPREHVKDGRITLNISPMAVQNLDLDSEPIWFSARFGGRPFEVIIPSGAVLAVFARENGEGVVFGEVEPPTPGDKKENPAVEAAPKEEKPKGARAHLKLVK